jgi:hypothetical protein
VINGIGGAGGHRGKATVQHGDVVVMIAGRENFFARHLD